MATMTPAPVAPNPTASTPVASTAPAPIHIGTHAIATPQRAAVVLSPGGVTLTYEVLNERSIKLAHRLRAAGILRGDHIAILMRNTADFLVACWAAQRAGLYYTPVNWHLLPDEVAYVIDDCGAQALIVSEAERAVAIGVRSRTPRLKLSLIDSPAGGLVGGTDSDGFESLADVYAQPLPETLLDESEGQMMVYSSGTTGRPKGIKRPMPVVPFGTPGGTEAFATRTYVVTRETVLLTLAPLYHAAPLVWAIATLRQGGLVVVMEKFDALESLKLIERFRVTHGQFVPTMFVWLLKLPEEQRAAYDLSSLRYVVHAGAPCSIEVKRKILDWLGPVVYEYYSGSESVGMCAVGPGEWLERPGTVGRSLFGRIYILDERGEELTPGEIGQVYFTGMPPFEYHNDPGKTKEAYSRQGYATMGDYGHLDAEGYLFLADRRTDLILSGGVNIYPRETEDALAQHPAVGAAAVVGVPSEEYGQDVLAVVELKPGFEPSESLAAELIAFSRERIAHYKCPRRVEFGDLPRSALGKLLRKKVKEQFSGGAAGGDRKGASA